MKGNADAFLIIIILIGLGVAWVVTGGPARVEKERGIQNPSVSIEEERTYRSLPEGTENGNETLGKEKIERELQKVEKELREVQKELEYIKKFGERSPYQGKITIERSFSGAKQKTPQKEYLIIKAAKDNEERVIITDWRFESSITGKSAAIKSGTSLPSSGSVNSETAIVLLPGDRAYVTTGRSPVGTSFRTNLCSGYFEQFQDFSPSLRRVCPDPDDELIDFGNGVSVTDDACYDYVRRLSRCSMVVTSTPLSVTNACWNFVTQNINYSGCVANHRGDPNFFGSEWRIFLGRSEELWRERREVIKLLDAEKRIVDTLTY